MRTLITISAAVLFLFAACKKETAPIPVPVQPEKPVTLRSQQTFGGSLDDIAKVVKRTADGGFIIAGTTRSMDGDIAGNNGEQDIFIAKYNTAGVKLWHKLLGSSGNDECKAMIATPDGGCLLAGQTGGNDGDVSGNHGGDDAWVVKLDATGNIQWKKCYGGSRSDFANAVAQSTDGGYVIAGTAESSNGDLTNNHGNYDAWVFKISANGQLEWQRSMGGSRIDVMHGVVCNADGSVVLGAYTESNNGDLSGTRNLADIWIIKLTGTGERTWSKTFGGSNSDYTFALSAVAGGYVATGYTTSSDGDMSGYKDRGDIWVLKVNDAGEKVWLKTIGGMGSDFGYGIAATSDNGIMVTGVTNSRDGDFTQNKGMDDVFVLKLDASGKLIWQKTAGSTLLDQAYSVLPLGTDACYVAARTYGNDGDVTGNHHEGSSDAWLLRFEK
ncbi:MAG: hypothetical protein NTW29_19260 [Bacteroidetes bacterium]|nr:hypothetical protein [Bacteroidota bacterium]